MTGAHLIKYTPQGIVCSNDECMREGDDTGICIQWPLDDDAPIGYGDVVAAAMHGWLYTAYDQYSAEGTKHKPDFNKAVEGAAAICEWAGVDAGDVQVHRCSYLADKLARAMTRRAEVV